MNIKGLNNPHNLWGKWVQIKSIQQYGVFALLFALCLIPSFHGLFGSLQQQTDSADQRLTVQQELAHQQQILTTLQKKAGSALLTPEFTKQLAPINQKIRQFSRIGEIQQEWQMSQHPKLNLQIQTSFANSMTFLTALLQDFPTLMPVSVQIEKAEQGVQIQLLFQLHIPQETP